MREILRHQIKELRKDLGNIENVRRLRRLRRELATLDSEQS